MKEKKKHKGTDYIQKTLLVFFLLVFLFALCKILMIMKEYKEVEQTYEGVREDYTQESVEKEVPDIEFEKLIKVNDDIIGWIYIKDTDINYPILIGNDNNQYLYQSYEKEYLVAGSIFMDYRCSRDFDDLKTVIYGHNMHNGSMFGKLDKYTKDTYREQHPYVYIILSDGKTLKYKIKDTKQVSIESEIYDLPSGANQDKNKNKNRLYLSTCTEDSSDTERFIVECLFVEEIEYIKNEKQPLD